MVAKYAYYASGSPYFTSTYATHLHSYVCRKYMGMPNNIYFLEIIDDKAFYLTCLLSWRSKTKIVHVLNGFVKLINIHACTENIRSLSCGWFPNNVLLIVICCYKIIYHNNNGNFL